MTALCCRASDLDLLDESLHILVIRSLVGQGKDAAALDRYEKATDLLYRSLGVTPSAELRDLYTAIMDTEKSMETDLAVIQQSLKETATRPGAFVCEYGFFREAYRLEARRAARNGTCVHLALLTVSLPGGGMPELGVLNTTMDQLLAVLSGGLRRGDVVSRYSGSQYVVMLPAANFEDSTMVMERIISVLYRQHGGISSKFPIASVSWSSPEERSRPTHEKTHCSGRCLFRTGRRVSGAGRLDRLEKQPSAGAARTPVYCCPHRCAHSGAHDCPSPHAPALAGGR